jgi:predicted permease
MTHDPSRLRRLLSLPRTARSLQRDVDDEIRFHIESRAAELVAAGAAPPEARAQAVAEYGDLKASRAELERVDRERLARQRWTAVLDAIRNDVAFGVRTLRKQPGYTAAVIVVLALGIGANATMFGVIDRLLLRAPAQVGAPEQVMTINFVRTIERDSSVQEYLSYPIYLDARAAQEVFASVAAYTPSGLAVGLGADAQSLRGMKVSASFFSTLQVRPAAGRFFLPEEDGNPTAPNVAVISYGYWQASFSGDRGVVGRTMRLGEHQFTIVGVAPKGFRGVGQSPVDVWIPITEGVTSTEYAGWRTSREAYWLLVVARLRPGVSRERATAVATGILRAGERRDGTSERRMAERQPRIGLQSILPREALARDPDAKVAVLLGAVSLLVLIIACANVTNLQLARAFRRRREVAVRIALGVSRRRLIGQLVIESLLLSLGGGAVALFVARFGGVLVRRVLFTSFDWNGAVADPRLLAYTAAAALAAGVLSGILPALHASALDLSASLKEGAREGRVHRTRTRAVLLVVQTTLSVLLLVGTGLFTRSLARVRALPLGMEPDRVLLGSVRTTGMSYTTAERLAMYQRLLQRTASVPGIESAALATSAPFNSSWATSVSIPGRDSVPTVKDGGPYFIGVTSGYLKTMGMRLLRGRGIEESDLLNAHRVVVVNEAIARLWWPGADAIGQCMKIGADTMPCTEVVGVVANPRRQSLLEDASLQFFLPIDQAPSWVDTRLLVIRPRGDAAATSEALRRQLQVAEPGLPHLRLQPLADLVNPETRSWRLGSTMFAAFGALALVLAAVGLYSMLAYDVGQRIHELGVRVALGARAPDVTRTVMDGGVRLVAVGIAIGIALTLAGGHFVQPLLFQTSAREPVVLAGAVAALAVVAVMAMLWPTWRATRVDPIIALRAD